MRESFQKISKFSVFFSWKNFAIFRQKNGENFGNFGFSSENFKLKFIFLGFKFRQNFDIKNENKNAEYFVEKLFFNCKFD
jgi:hypothetical protein